MDPSAPPPPPPSQPPPPPSKSYSGGVTTTSPPAGRPPPPRSPLATSSFSAFIFVIACIVAICFLASILIFFLIRFLSGRHRRSSFVADSPLPVIYPRFSSASEPSIVTALSDKEKLAIIDSLPLFSLSSLLSGFPKTSPDCAVCLSPFLPEDDLRLLPVCRHAFHADCIHSWLIVCDMPTCPLCRVSITIHNPLPLPSAPPLTLSSYGIIADGSRSGSFRVEFGSVSLRRAPSIGEPGSPNHLRTYYIDSEWEYLVEEEVEAVVVERSEKRPDTYAAASAEQVAGEYVGRSSRRLMGYADSVSLASWYFSSQQASPRWSQRNDIDGDAAVGWLPSWHREQSLLREAEAIGITSFYRWLVGAY